MARGEQDERPLVATGPDLLEQREAVEARQIHVADDQLGRLRANDVGRDDAVWGSKDLVAGLAD